MSKKKARTITLYRETYKADQLRIIDARKPVTTHQAPGFVVDEAFVLAAGRVQQDGKEREYQDLRIYYVEAEK